VRAVIAAIVSLDGAPVEVGELKRLAACARLPWGGAPKFFHGEGVGLAWIPAFSAAVCLPDVEDLRYEVVADGTLDNRAELARELGLPAEAAAPGGEPRIIAAAYERWGADCSAHLIGELAFLLWDRGERRLLAVRDVFGLRELFYTEDRRQIRIASQLQMVLDRPDLSNLDEEFVADFLACWTHAGARTPFKTVRRLQGGHQMTLAAGRSEIRRYWRPLDRGLPAGRSEGDVAEQFLAVFQEAVNRCLNVGGKGGTVWAELSGGLDSSSIVALAQAPGFATMTFVWEDTPQSDERSWAKAVVEKYGLINHQIVCDDLFFDGAAEESRYRSEPHFGILCHPLIRAESELLRARGVDVLLSGARAEAVVLGDWASPLHLADMVRSLRLGAFAKELLRWQKGAHRPLANLLLDFVLRPLSGRRSYLRSSEDTGVLNPWIDQAFARRMKMRERTREAVADKAFHSIAQQLQYEQLIRSEQMISRGFVEWSCEIRHPFLYRPLVELALSIPWEQKVSPREAKPLLRRALGDRLPEAVRNRRGGAGPGPSMYKAFAKRWGVIEPLVRSSRLVSMGFIDRAEFTRAAELARFGAAHQFVAFLSCLAFEYWLRTVTGQEEDIR